jgi:hypothetical protein
VGLEHACVLIFHERVAIKTTVLEKGRMEACSELRGENKFGLNHLFRHLQSHGHVSSSPKAISREELARH